MYQTAVLLLFNDEEVLSFSEIKKLTGLENQDLCRTLQSLACAKIRVLNKLPKTRDVSETDNFEFNSEFTHALKRITINQIQIKETHVEQANTEERVFEDRHFTIDACIVRILKTRRNIVHQVLVSELYETLKFPVQV
jgi:cullin-4